MAMGKRRRHARQKTMWVASTDLPQSAGHPFYERLNRVLDDIFVVRTEDGLIVKRLGKSTAGTWRLISDHPDKQGCRRGLGHMAPR